MEIVKVNDLNFHEHTKDVEYVVITFSANWCGKCKLLKPRLKQWKKELLGHVGIYEAKVEDSPMLREKLNIEHVPTTICLDKGYVLSRTHKIDQESIRDLLKGKLETFQV